MPENKPKRWESEKMVLRDPDDNIACKDCIYRLEDIKLKDGTVVKQYKKAVCEAFQSHKPREVLWESAKCPFYEKDEQGEAIDKLLREMGIQLDGGYGSGNWGHVGRPGIRGGSGAGGGIVNRITNKSGQYESLSKIWDRENGKNRKWDPKLPQSKSPVKNSAKLDAAEKKIGNKKIEFAYIFDADGNEIFNKTTHAKHSVSFDAYEVHKMKDATLTHNHPSGGTFSSDDLNTLVKSGAASIRATGKNGTYQLSRKADMNGKTKKDPNDFAADYEKECQQIKKELDKRWKEAVKQHSSGALTDYEANSIIGADLTAEFNYRRSNWLRVNAGSYGYVYTKDN